MTHQPSRRQFIQTSAAVAGIAILAPLGIPRAVAQTTKRTATDIVTLGQTGIKLSRLGIGTGVNNGADNLRDGKDAFVKTIRHAYDQGITYFDCAQRCATFPTMGEAIKGIPRDKIFIQSKIWPGDVKDVLAAIDAHRKNFNTDYVDSMLIHCRTDSDWTDKDKAMMEVYQTAKSRKWIRAQGVSCHSFEALQQANKIEWANVHLVRLNPQGILTDGPNGGWPNTKPNPIDPVLAQIKDMHDKGRGVIGMKIFGGGFMPNPADREKSIRFAMSNPNIDAVVIGATTPEQVNENIAAINRALAA